MRLSFEEINSTLFRILSGYGLSDDKAKLIASVHTKSSCDGVYSHGLNRFPQFIDFVKRNLVNPHAEPETIRAMGAIEQWDGNFGPGVWNATKAMNRAVENARKFGVGLITLRNTNHWMRGGTYGWQAAAAGTLAICFTNTIPNMPPWGGKENRIGNNPLVIAVPRKSGAHMVLDMSMSQFSFGKMNQYKLEGTKLPFPGGWDDDNRLSNDPECILSKKSALPIGYWKGSALSVMLDTVVSVLSMGNSTYRVGLEEEETGISQIFICIDPNRFGSADYQQKMIDEIIQNIHNVDLLHPDKATRYPGENTLSIRQENLKHGIPVHEEIWNEIMSLKKE